MSKEIRCPETRCKEYSKNSKCYSKKYHKCKEYQQIQFNNNYWRKHISNNLEDICDFLENICD